MKTWKLVSGILSIVLSLFVLFQSAAAGLSNALSNSDEISGSAGVLVALMLIAAGVVSIVVHNKSSKGGHIAMAALFALGALIGFTCAGSFSDLRIWAGWCLICSVLAIICVSRTPKNV